MGIDSYLYELNFSLLGLLFAYQCFYYDCKRKKKKE